MPSGNAVLVVDDDLQVRRGLERVLERAGYAARGVGDGRAALESVAADPPDVLLLDLHLPDQDGLSVLAALRAAGHATPVIMMSGEGTVAHAVRAVQLGALDFLQKPLGNERVLVTVQNALKLQRLVERNTELEAQRAAASGLLGESRAMQDLRALIAKAAPTEGRVLITGPNGTGKELVAIAIHQGSARRDGPFVKLNCAAIPAELFESELFGHERGSFTGAVAARRGRFERANGGSLFLDEIGEMPLALQAKLLRVLQEGEIERIGAHESRKVDVRVIAATNADLDRMIEGQRFREDLYYRLNVIHVRTPALREHPEDIPPMAERFLEAARARNTSRPRALSPEALAALTAREYRGNVRELQNLVERLAILVDHEVISAADVATLLGTTPRSAAPSRVYRPGVPYRTLIAEAQRAILQEALDAQGGNVTATALSLDIERSHLHKKCRALGLRP